MTTSDCVFFSGGGVVAARLRIRAVEAGWRDEEGKFIFLAAFQ